LLRVSANASSSSSVLNRGLLVQILGNSLGVKRMTSFFLRSLVVARTKREVWDTLIRSAA
jgi:hypothetical protein